MMGNCKSASLQAPRSPGLPSRDGSITIAQLCDAYMAQYSGRDTTRVQRLSWWRDRLGSLRLDELTDDHLHDGIEALASQASRYYAGKDADGHAIFKPRRQPRSGATLNRYTSAIAAVITWAIRTRAAPKGFDHPGRRIQLRKESPGKVRFLSDDERSRLLQACKASTWPRLYMLVLLALTTGARKGELLGLRWQDVDTTRRVVHIGQSKNGDPKALPLVPAAVEQLEEFRGSPGALVFPSRLRADKPMAFESRWSEALTAAGITKYRFHDNRHSCASYLAQNGASLLEIAAVLGHRQISMSQRYSHLSAGHSSALVDRVFGAFR
jgi:integrase